jgi:FG-GAP repeat
MKAPRLARFPWLAALVALCASCAGEWAPAPAERFTLGTRAGLRAELGPRGVAVTSVHAGGSAPERAGATWAWDATPARWGCEGNLAPVPPAQPEARGGRVEYRREGLSEWYVDGPRGVEQGFTLAAPPACGQAEGRAVVVELAGGLAASVLAGGRTAVLRDGAGREVMRYADLSVVDAAGRELPAELRAGRGGALAIRFDDRGAVYPVTVDPLMWVQQGELLATDGQGSDNFGWSVALSGSTAILGAPDKSSGLGAVYVFVRSCASWSQQQELGPAGGVSNQGFGAAVALDGDTAIVGAQAAESYRGAAYVFVRSAGVWTQQQALVAADGAPGDQFGAAVAVGGDTAIVGASGNDGSRGAAYVFTRSGGMWSLQQKIHASGGAAGDQLGSTAALAGETVVLGAPGSDSQRGAGYAFVRAGSAWSEQQKLTAGDGQDGDQLGTAIALDGDTALLGTYEKAASKGAAYAFVRSGAAWSQQQELAAADGVTGDRFGWAVALAGDSAVVGAPLRAESQGSAYVFARSGGTWSLAQTLAAADGATGDSFGYTAASSGTTAVVGALFSAMNQGAAYVYAPATMDDCGAGGGSAAGGTGGGSDTGAAGGTGGTDVARDLRDHVPFAFRDCGCRVAGEEQGVGRLPLLALTAVAAGLAASRRRARRA